MLSPGDEAKSSPQTRIFDGVKESRVEVVHLLRDAVIEAHRVRDAELAQNIAPAGVWNGGKLQLSLFLLLL